ncbi:soluble lytic murein transglycosylase-like protein [Burkholderiales bacterium JOSHI_001]|nr:soluble lytic murein transglycosylase-like protein [Burkholderiales bacterium JOSHI_001]
MRKPFLLTSLAAGLLALATLATPLARAQGPGAEATAAAPAEPIVDAREALRRKDRARLAQQRAAVLAAQHPLAPWVDYWELSLRLPEASVDEVEAFYARWPGTYMEDRLRNDWLLELGKRRDWANLARDVPRFRMNDDREVACYAQLAALQLKPDADRGVREAARSAWLAQREADDGCQQLATLLVPLGAISTDDLWRKARQAAENNKPRLARLTLTLAGPHAAREAAEVVDNPMRYLRRAIPANTSTHAELALLAVLRLVGNDPDTVATLLDERWSDQVSGERAAYAWAFIARQAAHKLQPDAHALYQRAWSLQPRGTMPRWSDETLAWAARAALRAPQAHDRWAALLRSVQALQAAEANDKADPAWVYWKARALQALAPAGEAGQAQRDQAQALMQGLAGPLSFYAKLAAEDLGLEAALPAPPPPPTAEERDAARRHPGLARALRLVEIGLRSEGVREWNFSVRWMGDRELLAAAQLACEREVWDRCISTSERMREGVDLAQRFPTPHRDTISARAREAGLEPAFVYGLIRQESRFVSDARSGVGASGLMQVMPATARWTANKLGLPYSNGQITDRDTNLRLGMGYMKLLLDDLAGSQAMASAAYNAGPNRPRRWRDGPVLEPAAWIENIPFNETRDYVKKVLSNASVYAALLGGQSAPQLRSRLGQPIGPREATAPPVNSALP